MSLSWLDRLTLFIHPQRVVLEKQPWRGAASWQMAEAGIPAAGEPDWLPALSAARTLLEASGRGSALCIVVADHFVRYALLPWSDMLTGKQARLGMARALFRNALGDKAEALEIALDRPAFGKNGIAAGLDRPLLVGLRALAKARRLRLNSLQPRLMAELAAAGGPLNDGWFACLDDGWVSLAGVRDGAIASLRNHRASTADSTVLARELAGLLIAESSTVNGKKVLISTLSGMLPALPAGWDTSPVTAICGAAHA